MIAAIVQPGERVRDGQLDALLQTVAQIVGMALALDLGAHPGQQLVAIDGARQIVVHAHVERAQQARLVARLRHDDDRQMARALERAHLAAQPQAVGSREVQADDQQIVGAVAEPQQRACGSVSTSTVVHLAQEPPRRAAPRAPGPRPAGCARRSPALLQQACRRAEAPISAPRRHAQHASRR